MEKSEDTLLSAVNENLAQRIFDITEHSQTFVFLQEGFGKITWRIPVQPQKGAKRISLEVQLNKQTETHNLWLVLYNKDSDEEVSNAKWQLDLRIQRNLFLLIEPGQYYFQIRIVEIVRRKR
ncbi:MAG TPA: hypothetical protein PLD54_02655 [Candidatus Levybacteria bacterium]|nr:hypothetical protein [Candidatus Levybacteria bacterium]